MSWPAVKKFYTIAEFEARMKDFEKGSWQPQFIVLHNTAVPTLADWPKVIGTLRMAGLENYYKNDQKWSGGPHLFVAPEGVWEFNDLRQPGVHSPSWNRIALGVEMVGDFDHESFASGAGLLVRSNAVRAVAALSLAYGLDTSTMRLHREDPQTTHHCPGNNVIKAQFIAEAHAAKLKLLGATS